MRDYLRKGLVLLLAVLMLGVAACGTKEDPKPQDGGVTEQPTPTGELNQEGGVTNTPEQPEEETPAQPTEQPEEETPTQPTEQPEEETPAQPTEQPEEETPAQPTEQPEEETPAQPTKQPEEETPAQPTKKPEQPKEPELKQLTYGGITTGQTTIKTKHLELHIPANVYIPDKLVENIDILTSTMETVSGMKFAGNPKYSTERLQVEVEKLTDTECELGAAYAYPGGLVLSSGDLVDLFTLVHEASHALQYNQSRWSYCTWAMEGISTYTTYKTQEYIEQNHPELVTIVGNVNQCFLNYSIDDYDELYKHPMEYWADHTFEYAGNVNYTIGFRFMWYLDEVYGDYTKWIYEYEKANPYNSTTGLNDMLATEEQMKAFRMTYGDDVFDGFYTWVENNRERFEVGYIVDLSQAEEVVVYPMCANREISYTLWPEFRYKDLWVRIDEGREYLSEYKGKETKDMVLDVGADVVLELYDAEGNLLRTEGPTQYNQTIALDGVGSFKLVGEGILTQFSITGFENYE